MAHEVDELAGKDEAGDAAHGQDAHVELHAEEVALAHAPKQPCPVVEAAEGLETLPHANDDGKHEEAQPPHYRHAGNGRIAIYAGGQVEQHHGHGGQSLASERGSAALYHFHIVVAFPAGVFELDVDVVAMVAHDQEHHKAEYLAQDSAYAGTQDAHAQREGEYGHKHHVEHGSGHHAIHGIGSIALEAHLVVEQHRPRHERRTQQHHGQVLLGIGQNGGSGPAPHRDGREQQQACHSNDHTGYHSSHKGRRGHLAGIGVLLGAQLPRDVGARALTEEETNGLYHRLQREGDTHCGRGLGVDEAHIVGVDDVVDARDEHRDNRGHGHTGDDAAHRACSEKGVVVATCVHAAKLQKNGRHAKSGHTRARRPRVRAHGSRATGAR